MVLCAIGFNLGQFGTINHQVLKKSSIPARFFGFYQIAPHAPAGVW
jgi:hypothetical protein